MLPVSLLIATQVPSANLQPIQLEGMLCHPRNVMVKVTDGDKLAAITKTGAKVLRYMPQIQWAVVEAPLGKLQATRNAISKLPGVEESTYDRAAKLAYIPNDPKWPDQWHMRAIKADLAWDTHLGSSAVTVAVLDTGVQMNHPDLAANIWKNPAEIVNNRDDDGNGYIDDINGYDFAYNDNNPSDDHGHGTACAGIVAGVGDNGIGVTGVAPRAKIMVIKNATTQGYFYDSANVPAYLYAADNGAKVFSMSYYSDRVSSSERDALEYAFRKGVLPIAAAGNDSTVLPYYPASHEVVMSVAAVTPSGTPGVYNKAGFSNWGSLVDVAAPGTGLTTTARNSTYTSSFGGTSGACPHVAGLAALLLGVKPSMPPMRVRRAIEDTAVPLSQEPIGEYSNYGMIDADEAMHAFLKKSGVPKDPVVRWISPIGINPYGTTRSTVYGRSLTNAQVQMGGVNLQMGKRTRDWANYILPSTNTGTVDVLVDGQTIASYTPPIPDSFVFPVTDISNRGGYIKGGMIESLNADSQSIHVKNIGGDFIIEGSFRYFPRKGKATIIYRRQVLNHPFNTDERVEVYEFTNASFPYGRWVPYHLGSGNSEEGMKRYAIPVSDMARYVDVDGTVFFRIYIHHTNADAELLIDQLYLKRGYYFKQP